MLAEEAQSTPPPPAPKQPSTSNSNSSPTVCPRILYSILYPNPANRKPLTSPTLASHRHLYLLLGPPQSPVPPYPETVDPLPHAHQSLSLSNRSRHPISSLRPSAQIFLPTRLPSPSSAITFSLSLQTAGARKPNVSLSCFRHTFSLLPSHVTPLVQWRHPLAPAA